MSGSGGSTSGPSVTVVQQQAHGGRASGEIPVRVLNTRHLSLRAARIAVPPEGPAN